MVKSKRQQNASNASGNSGGSFSPQYTDRISKIYNVHEMELDSLSFANELRTAFFSVATFFIGVSAECFLSPTNDNIIYKNVSFVLFIVFFILGIVAWVHRSNIVKKIKLESKLK